jgi:hypothetical protein
MAERATLAPEGTRNRANFMPMDADDGHPGNHLVMAKKYL